MPAIDDSPTRVIKTLAPGQPGTLKLVREHGPALVCVRYRVDAARARRYTTVELIIDDAPRQHSRPDRAVFHIRTHPGERHLRAALHAMGARWDSTYRTWKATAKVVRLLQLQDRAVRIA